MAFICVKSKANMNLGKKAIFRNTQNAFCEYD